MSIGCGRLLAWLPFPSLRWPPAFPFLGFALFWFPASLLPLLSPPAVAAGVAVVSCFGVVFCEDCPPSLTPPLTVVVCPLVTTLLPFLSEPDGETLPDLLPLRRRDELDRDELADEGREMREGGASVALEAEGGGLLMDVLAEEVGSGGAIFNTDSIRYSDDRIR